MLKGFPLIPDGTVYINTQDISTALEVYDGGCCCAEISMKNGQRYRLRMSLNEFLIEFKKMNAEE